MAKDSPSPEEKLFNVIQKDKEATPQDASQSKTSIKKSKLNLNFKPIKRFFGNLKPRPKAAAAPQGTSMSLALPARLENIEPKVINEVLIIILVILTVFIMYYAISKRPKVSDITSAVSKITDEYTRKRKIIENFKPVAFYLEAVDKRDIFKPSPRTELQVSSLVPKTDDVLKKLEEIASDLKLVGVSWGLSPQAMIKSNKMNTTYFVKERQMIGSSGVELKRIYRNKVVISYQEREIELQW